MITRTLQLVALVVLSASASAQQRMWAHALTTELETISVRFESINAQQRIHGQDRDGFDKVLDPDTLLAMWFEDSAGGTLWKGREVYDAAVLIELTDGQRLLINIDPSEDPESIVGTRYDGNERVRIPIDRLRGIVSRVFRAQPLVNEDDALRLGNGDTITGFITQIGTEFRIDTPSGEREIPLELIDAALIQNPPVHTPGTYVRTAFGERLRVRSLVADEKRSMGFILDDPVYVSPTIEPAKAPSDLLAIEYKRSDMHLMNPMLVDPMSISPTGDRAWVPVPTTSTSGWAGTTNSAVRVHSPCNVRWSVPDNSIRFSASIRTGNGLWTDNETSIVGIDRAGDEHVLWTRRLTAQSPMIDLVVELPVGCVAIELRVDPGAFGPIQDTVWIRLTRLIVSGLPEFE